MSSLKNMNFHYRKTIHYILLISVVSLQIIVAIWYKQLTNDKEKTKTLTTLQSSKDLQQLSNKLSTSIINSQVLFNDYSNKRDPIILEKYTNSIKEIKELVIRLHTGIKNNSLIKHLFIQKKKTESDIIDLENAIDSIISIQTDLGNDKNSENFKFKKIEFQKTLDNLKTYTYMMVDSVFKKGFFSRLDDAISGKLVIQKERLNTVVTMKYKDKVTSGSLEDQIKNVIFTTDKYYKNEFNNSKKKIVNLKDHDKKLLLLNNKLLNFSYTILPSYNGVLNTLQTYTENKLLNQNKAILAAKNYMIVILVLLMLFISLIFLNFTRIAFNYEKRLTQAQEQIYQSLKFKNKIIDMISHEIRSPLNIISIYSKKISSSIKDNEVKETFNSIQFTTDSLVHLSNQILEYSKGENYHPQLKFKEFNLTTEIDKIINSMTSFAETKGNKIVMQSNINRDCIVYSDATKIHQLFYNIIGNANKFTDNGTISIDLMLVDISNYERDLNIEVRDNGIGIAQSDLNRIFDSYFQGSCSEKINDIGVGLGLNLCKEIVSLFGGQINIESEQANGTTVKFNLILSQI